MTTLVHLSAGAKPGFKLQGVLYVTLEIQNRWLDEGGKALGIHTTYLSTIHIHGRADRLAGVTVEGSCHVISIP